MFYEGKKTRKKYQCVRLKEDVDNNEDMRIN